MTFVMNLCDYLYVLDFGVMIAQGRPMRFAPTRRFSIAIWGTHVMLQIRNLAVSYGPSPRYAASTSTSQRAIVALIRPTRWQDDRRPRDRRPFAVSGEILYAGPAEAKQCERNVRLGIAWCRRARHLASMTVEEIS